MNHSESGTIVCPRCGNQQPRDTNCHRCGLLFSKWRGSASVFEEIEDTELGAMLISMWSDLEQHFSDEARHRAFIEVCTRYGVMDICASLYRMRVVADPDDKMARQQQQQIVSLVQQQLFAAGSKSTDSTRRVAKVMYWVVGILFSLAFLGASFWLLQNLNTMWHR